MINNTNKTNSLPPIKNTLRVYLNQTLVGTISRLQDDRNLFLFDQSYIRNPKRPTLSLSFKDTDGELITENKITKTQLPPFFSNLLPEGYLRDYLATKQNIKPQREFFLLMALGQDLPGATRIESVTGTDAEQTVDKTVVTHKSDDLRFSLAGIQLKFSAVMETSGGLTIPDQGIGGAWIVKLPSNVFANVPQAEYSMLKLAREAGIEVPEFKLVPTKKIHNLPDDIPQTIGDSLAVKRFDRLENGKRVHMEDFAQVFGLQPNDKYKHVSYDQIAKVLWLETGENGFTQFIQRLVFSLAVGNGDMHLKNWSLLYKDGINPTLSPAYDLVPTFLYVHNDNLALNLGKTKDFNQINLDNFKRLAARAMAPERLVTHTVKTSIARIQQAWESLHQDLPLPDVDIKKIEKHMESLPLFKTAR